jgi:hypothetical protein
VGLQNGREPQDRRNDLRGRDGRQRSTRHHGKRPSGRPPPTGDGK